MSAGKPYILILPALLGAILVLYATGVYGTGVDGDSVNYYNAAYNLLTQRAFLINFTAAPAESVTHWPPLYPAVLAPFHLSGAGIEFSTRILNAGLFLLYLLGVQLLVLRATDGSVVASLLAGFFTALSTVALSIYARMWSETLFLVLFVFGMLLLCRYIQSAGRHPAQRAATLYLLAAAGLFALAWLARYVGVTLVAAGGLAILLWSSYPLRRRARDVILFGLVASAPMAAFLLRNYLATENVTSRAVSYHPVSAEFWREGMDTLSAWLIPIAVPVWMKAVAAAAVLAIAALGLVVTLQNSRRPRVAGDDAPRAWIVPAVLLLFSAIYLSFFYAVVTFADSGHLSGRTLSPIYTSLVVVAAYAGQDLAHRYGQRRPALRFIAILVLCGGLLSIQLVRTTVWTSRARLNGFDYSGREWRTALAVDVIRGLPDGTSLYSNWPHVVYFLTGRLAHPIAFARCYENCQALASEFAAIPEEHRVTAVLIWAKDQGSHECYDCFHAVSAGHGFAPVHEDSRFQLFAPAQP